MPAQLKFHEYADLFPKLNKDQTAELGRDIKQNGLHDPIMLFEGTILDGRTRYLACMAEGVDPHFYEFEGTNREAFDLTMSRNLHRRHLTNSQRAMVAAKVANLSVGANQHSGEGVPNGTASKMLNVSPRSLARAKTIVAQGHPELVHAVEAGTIALAKAAEIAKLEMAEQPAAVAEAINRPRSSSKRRASGQPSKEAVAESIDQPSVSLPTEQSAEGLTPLEQLAEGWRASEALRLAWDHASTEERAQFCAKTLGVQAATYLPGDDAVVGTGTPLQ